MHDASMVRIAEFKREGNTVPERREEDRWTSPRNLLGVASLLVSVCGLFAIIFGGLIGTYVVLQTRTTTSEISNAQLAQQVSALGVKVDKMTEAINDSTTGTIELRGAVETIRRDLDGEIAERKGQDKWLEARIVSGK